MKFGSLFSGIGGFDLGEDDAITTICDRCGCDLDLAEANYAGPELPLWEGATLCNECYAAERVSEPQLAANRTCATCGKVADAGYHTTCDHCGRPVCAQCAVQFTDGVFCPTCPRGLPF